MHREYRAIGARVVCFAFMLWCTFTLMGVAHAEVTRVVVKSSGPIRNLSNHLVGLDHDRRGIVRPRASAVLRLMTKSNAVGRSMGKSAGIAPFKILST